MSDPQKTPIRVAVVGLGLWGARAHLPALVDNPDAEVVAVVDENQALAKQIASPFGIFRVETDAARLFDDRDGIDAIVIATPDDTHRDLAIGAFNAGIDVLCEKPLAFDLTQAEEMSRVADETGRITKLGFLSRFSPALQRMKAMTDSGAVGTIQAIESHTVNSQFIDPARPLHWKMQRERANGGVFVEYGSHAIDLALWFGGPIKRVVAHARTVVPKRIDAASGREVSVEVDDMSSWLAEFEDGSEASFRMSWAAFPVGGGGLRVYGSNGSLGWQQDLTGRRSESLVAASFDDPTPHVVFENTPPHDSRFDEGDFPLGLLARFNAGLIASFMDDIRTRSSTGPNFADGLAAQRVLQSIGESLQVQSWVDVPGTALHS